MGAARQRKIRGETDDLRYIAWPHDARLLVLSILRGVAARTRDAKRSLWKAISATAYEEEEAEAFDEHTEELNETWRKMQILAGSRDGEDAEEYERIKARRKELLAKQKTWMRETETLALSTNTLATILETCWAAEEGVTGRHAEKLVPWLDTLQEAKDAKEDSPYRKAPEEEMAAAPENGEKIRPEMP